MATIRKRRGKYEVQVRHIGQPQVSKSFHELKDAKVWARMMEVRADRHDLPTDRKALHTTLGELVAKYRDTVSVHKRSGGNGTYRSQCLSPAPNMSHSPF